MAVMSLRPPARDPREPVRHDLRTLRIAGREVQIRLLLRAADDGAWRGRLHFTDADSGRERETAEIFRGASERDVWQSLAELGEHHLRDLYRALD